MLVFMWENKKKAFGNYSHITTAILVEVSGAAVGREGLWTVGEERWYRLPLFSMPLSTMNWKSVAQGYTDLPKICKPFQNSRHLKGAMQQLQYWERTSIRHHCRKFSHQSNLAPGIFAHLSPVLITVSQCEQGAHIKLFYKLVKLAVQTFLNAIHEDEAVKKICSVWLVQPI